MTRRKSGCWKTLIGIGAGIVILLIVGYLCLAAFARDEVQWAFMNELRHEYFPTYYKLHKAWPKDLSGVREFFKASKHARAHHLILLLDSEQPTLDVITSSRERFIGKLRFHSFLSTPYDIVVEAPATDSAK